jgi:hypothetical protein
VQTREVEEDRPTPGSSSDSSRGAYSLYSDLVEYQVAIVRVKFCYGGVHEPICDPFAQLVAEIGGEIFHPQVGMGICGAIVT